MNLANRITIARILSLLYFLQNILIGQRGFIMLPLFFYSHQPLTN